MSKLIFIVLFITNGILSERIGNEKLLNRYNEYNAQVTATLSSQYPHNNQPPVYFKSLLEAGNIVSFTNQFQSHDSSETESEATNQARSNISVAERLLDYMDLNVNPCENFYQFACGGFASRNNSQSGRIFSFRDPESKVIEAVKEQLEKPSSLDTPKPLRKARQFYMSCMDEVKIERRGLQPVLNFLSKRGGWPVLGEWNYSSFDFINMLGHSNKITKDPLVNNGRTIIGVGIGKDVGKNDQYTIYLGTPGLGQFNIYGQPNHEVYRLGRNSIYNKAYEEYLVDLAVAFGADPVTAKQDMCGVVEFETELANSFLFVEESRQFLERYNKISILELSMRYPQIDWLHYLREVLSIAKIRVDLSTKVVLFAEKYYDRLVKILSRIPKRTLANYIMFRSIQPLLPALPRHIQYITLRYNAVISGATDPGIPERSGFCSGVVNAQMDWLASRLFVENNFDIQKLRYITEIKDYVRSIVLEMLQTNPWLSSVTKTLVLRKVSSVTTSIGYPDKLFDDRFLDDYYKKFDIGKHFFENMEEVLVENRRRQVSKLIRHTPEDWLLRPTLVNAIYIYAQLSINMPYAIFDEPFFSNDYTPSMNFGGIGSLIGHEYGHAIDDTNVNFDWNGMIRRFWTDFSIENFKVRTDCLIRQYSEYFIPDVSLAIKNGNKTLNENIADSVGPRVAFYAYKKWKAKHKMVDDFVQGLPFNGEQLYFINFARQWCLSTSNIFLRKLPLLDTHAVNRFRVIGPLQNMPEFSKVFNCPIGSSMNPVKKCRVW